MINETVFLGECPIIRPEGIYYGGRRVIALNPNLSGLGFLGDAGDLLAYRQEWEPFISAHLALWRDMNALLESIPDAQKCPPGIFDPAELKNLDPTTGAFCASLDITRIRVSATNPGGILQQWNLWKDKSSADIVAGAAAMLKWHQDTVTRVADSYKNELLQIAKLWNVPVQLPEVPTFSAQQEIIARIEGAYISTKGILQILGYGAGEVLDAAATQTQAVAQGLTETVSGAAKAITSPWTWIGVAAVLAVAGGALLVYYVPRAPQRT
jgi:hypothetical protein